MDGPTTKTVVMVKNSDVNDDNDFDDDDGEDDDDVGVFLLCAAQTDAWSVALGRGNHTFCFNENGI